MANDELPSRHAQHYDDGVNVDARHLIHPSPARLKMFEASDLGRRAILQGQREREKKTTTARMASSDDVDR